MDEHELKDRSQDVLLNKLFPDLPPLPPMPEGMQPLATLPPANPYEINWDKERSESGFYWRDLLSSYPLDLPKLTEELMDRVLYIPRDHPQRIPMISVLCTPTGLHSIAPRIWCCGEPHSGKSSFGVLCSALYGSRPLSASSTYASLRNDLEKIPRGNAMLVWEDIEPRFLKYNKELFSLFKSGYNASTSIIKTASQDSQGENKEYDSFGLIVASTIHPIWDIPEFLELKRRSMWFVFKKVNLDELDIDLVKFEDINFNRLDLDRQGIALERNKYWFDGSNRERWKDNKRRVKSSRKRSLGSKELTGERRTLSDDLITTTLTIYPDLSLDDAFGKWNDYWSYIDSEVLTVHNTNTQVLNLLLDNHLKAKIETFSQLKAIGAVTELTLDPSEVKAYFQKAYSDGVLNIRPDNNVIQELMASRNWIVKDVKGVMQYVRE